MRRTPSGAPPIRALLPIAAAVVAIAVVAASQQSGRTDPARAAGAGIDNIASFLEQCPTNDPVYQQIRNDFQVRREGVVVGALSCTEPISAMPDAQYTDELIAVQALRTIFYMEGGRNVPYPWTQGSLYDWMKSKIGGIDIRATGSNCCSQYDGKWFVMIQSQSVFDRDRDKQWRGLSQNITLLGHEVRHVDGFPHVGGCPLFPNVTYGCDQTYDPANPSPYGVQWWLNAKWLSGEINVGFSCLSTAVTIAINHISAANNDYRQRFVTNPPPLLTMPPQPGGPCPGSTPGATPTPATPPATPGPLLQGDVDCDGRVSALDAIALLRFWTHQPVVQNEPCPNIGTNVGRPWGDVDCSGQVDAADGLQTLRHVLWRPVVQNEPCPDIGAPL